METTQNFSVAYNARTSLYEVHKTGCKHLIAKHFQHGSCKIEASTGAEAGQTFESQNDGCYTKLGPCARGAAEGSADGI